MSNLLSKTDPKIYKLIKAEVARQNHELSLIASENYVSRSVLEALGTPLTNKYSEGYPGKRYYGGNEFIDELELLAQERAKKLFGVNHANVQPYSGSPANLAVCFALLNPGDKLMGLHLFYGGHLTHGWKVNFSGVYYNAVQYVTGKDGWLDYNALEKQVTEERPRLIFIGATAYPRIFDWAALSRIAQAVDAYLVADISHIAGLVVAQVHPSPAPYVDVITTTTHKTLRGPRGAMILCNGDLSNPLQAPMERSRKYLPTMIDRAVFPGLQGGPHNHQTAAIAVALAEAARPAFRKYGEQIVKNARVLAEVLLAGGLDLVTGGTDNHLILADVTSLGLSGKEAENLLGMVGITVNKNVIPFDTRKPFDPSGIRLGTPGLTTRGLKEREMRIIGAVILEVLKNPKSGALLQKSKKVVKELTVEFPVY